ncbi:MAG: metallophosphoesterase family protein [Myxococcales bacterium]|nr:metallophosphoesterase family protein [Myxococcales bacterium]
MQIAVVSDLHLGAKDRLDRFHRADAAEDRLMAFLGELERAVDRVVLCGDIFETLRGRLPGPSRRALADAMAAYPQLSRRITEDRRYVLVHGNHDTLAGPLLGAPEFHWEQDGGLKMVFFHGHQLDRLARGNAPLSRLGVWAGGVLERFGVNVTHRVDAVRGHAYDDDSAPTLPPHQRETAAVALGKAMGADVIINGHTHNLVHRELEGVVYLNSGTCLTGRREAVIIDTAGPRFETVVK